MRRFSFAIKGNIDKSENLKKLTRWKSENVSAVLG